MCSAELLGCISYVIASIAIYLGAIDIEARSRPGGILNYVYATTRNIHNRNRTCPMRVRFLARRTGGAGTGAYSFGPSQIRVCSSCDCHPDRPESYFDITGIYYDGATFTGGLDGASTALSGYMLLTNHNWASNVFAFGSVGQPDAVSAKSQSIALPAGNFHSIGLLATGVNGNQIDQKFTVAYTDGSVETYVQSISDWYIPQRYTGQTAAISMPYRLLGTGMKDHHPVTIYVYSFTLSSHKTVSALILPNNSNLRVYAVTLR